MAKQSKNVVLDDEATAALERIKATIATSGITMTVNSHATNLAIKVLDGVMHSDSPFRPLAEVATGMTLPED